METTTPVTAVAGNARSLVAGAHQAVDKLADVASHAAETLADNKQRLGKARTDLIEGCRCYVGDHPAISLGIAVAAGFLLRHLIGPR